MKNKYLTMVAFLLMQGLSYAGVTQIDPDFMLFADQDMPVGYCGVYHDIDGEEPDPDRVCVNCDLYQYDSLFDSQWCGNKLSWDTGVEVATGMVVTITQNKKYNPKPGKFEYGGPFMGFPENGNGFTESDLANFDGCAMFYPEYYVPECAPAADACVSGETGPIVVAIHADIYNYYKERKRESAWLAECLSFDQNGDCQERVTDFAGKNWATYVHVPCSLPGICEDGLLSCGVDDNDNVVPFCDSIQYSEPETCDGLDNDCDGDTDEGFPDLGLDCTAGLGECEESGFYVCNAAGDDTECDAVAGPPTDEVCGDNLDNDCDGLTDDADIDDCQGIDEDDDGFTVADGDCNDDPAQGGAYIYPGAFECNDTFPHNSNEIDNDCDHPTNPGGEGSTVDDGEGCYADSCSRNEDCVDELDCLAGQCSRGGGGS